MDWKLEIWLVSRRHSKPLPWISMRAKQHSTHRMNEKTPLVQRV